MGRCTQGQADKLAEFGYDADGWSFEDARETLDQLAENRWQPLADGPPMPVEATNQRKPASRGQSTRQAPPPRNGGQRPPSNNRGNQRSSGSRTSSPPRGRSNGSQRGKPTPRMLEVLAENGYDASAWTFEQAGDKIKQLRENNWEPLEDDQDFGGQPEVEYGDDDAPFGE